MPARAVSGPYRIWVTLLCAALPVLTLGFLGMVPSAVLAAGRRRPADLVGAVVVGLMQLGMFVALGLTPTGGTLNTWVALLLVIPLWIGTPVHFLVMNQRRFWPAADAPAPYPYPAYRPYPASAPTYPAAGPYAGHPYTDHPYADHPQAVTRPVPPAVPPAGAAGAAGATGAAELRELGELLRRQAGDGQP
ncbi:hypothetical protein [Kitasatospora sp. CB02891]|uniref:hypothetical protein n=1 Tax=Kitasatospora sp. CB02891 TaxID=2020329 RepID=UPI000C273C06|nr:hypothetical protein [Kitasatospora sp. CB02891]PJN22529.1 hypothetical protein CG736_26690 [Kitasatospora sp. CB02891]